MKQRIETMFEWAAIAASVAIVGAAGYVFFHFALKYW
jgi:hypothetical protein